MKKLLAILLSVIMVLSLVACGNKTQDETPSNDDQQQNTETETKTIKVGLICIGDENDQGYTYNFIRGKESATEALAAKGINVDWVVKYNIGEDSTCEDANIELAEEGCELIFNNSYGFEPFMLKVAPDYPEIQFVGCTNQGSWNDGLDNTHNAFANIYEGRYVAGVAAGLATCGKIPFVVTYAVFGSLRMCEMIRQEICYPNLNVKIACSHGGVTPANDGASHQSIEDMGVLRTIPNMTVIMPADYNAARKLVRQAAETYGPMYLRFTRDAVPQIYDEDVEFTIGKAHQIQDGKDVAIIANGDTVRLAIEAAKVLAGKGISARVLDMHTIKPLDVEAVTAAINDIGKVITVEDHNIINGLGSAVCEVAAEMGKGLVKRVGIRDQFGQSAPYERLLAMNGVTVEDIVAIAESMNA